MPTMRERIETFEVRDGHLVRSVVPARRKPYEHRCPGESFETVAHAVEEFGERFFHLLDPDGHELSFAEVLRSES